MSTNKPEPDNYREVLKNGSLKFGKVPLLPGEQPERVLLLTPDAYAWIKNELPKVETDGYVLGAIKPREQVLQLFRAYRAGHDFQPPLPHDMGKLDAGVLELRTDDVRLFGWVPRKGMLCIAFANTKLACKNHGLYDVYHKETIRVRAAVGLYGGNFLTGNIDDLI